METQKESTSLQFLKGQFINKMNVMKNGVPTELHSVITDMKNRSVGVGVCVCVCVCVSKFA